MTGEKDINTFLPDYSASLFASYAYFIGSLITTAVVHEFYYTLVSSLSLIEEPENLHTPFYKRIDDVIFAITGGLFTAIYNILMRFIYTPFALLFSIFSLLDFTIHLVGALAAITIAVFLNVSYLAINNALIHIFLLGFTTHTLLTMTGIFGIIDNASKERFFRGIEGIMSSFTSLYELLTGILFNLFPIILGMGYLAFPSLKAKGSSTPTEELTLQFVKVKKNSGNCVYGIDCNLISASHHFVKTLSLKAEDFAIGIAYICSTPAFISMEILIFLAIALCSITKLSMSFPQKLFRSASSTVFQAKSNEALLQEPLLLASLRENHEKAYEARIVS